ncbi:hypothetical protein COY16_05445 [Candidatus Roizmanbacteria bacterium CG_4_10_14_0_2_um_filter_39_13]|uniref:Dipeptidylpeptidase IV N-terminal domain-containing protein n=1 Tax=Candidatus Roizmanbacteria bacterium CG_4_10_14_0_2_um_filter_39_13 TaxID=1974825 RepID=A0A2M7TW04_9BACT|nr:MAG: hypothetical protein COY16_05445 [Candidatus Roizmanbacteria bacterium CG_4_10_14_0_2_um_filter_39_13]
MTTSKLKLFAFILILLIVGIAWISLSQKQYSTDTRAYADVPDSSTPIPSLTVPQEIVTEVMDSPDGAQSLSMERQENGNDFKYSFHILDEGLREFLYTKELSSSRNMTIPYNTWSPDNKYFFLKESGLVQDEYYVFHATGENFPNLSQYINVQELFNEKIDGYEITEVTGWADPVLLIVNTQEEDGDSKVSFWLDVRSQSFIKLGTYFR